MPLGKGIDAIRQRILAILRSVLERDRGWGWRRVWSWPLVVVSLMPVLPNLFPPVVGAPESVALAIAQPRWRNLERVKWEMDAETIRAKIHQAAESWSHGQARNFAEMFTPDGEFVVPGQRYVGVVAIEQAAAEFFQTHSQVTVTIQRILIDSAQAVVEWRWEDMETNTGQRSVADDAIVVDFADGKIQRWREYIDSQTPAESAPPQQN